MTRHVVLLLLLLSGCRLQDEISNRMRTAGASKDETLPAHTSVRPSWQRVAVPSDRLEEISGTDEFGYPLATADKTEILGLLRAREFDRLDSVLRRYHAAFEADYRRELWLFDAYGAVAITDPAVTALLDAWVEERPASYAARLARAVHLQALGWESRGSRWAKDTSNEQFDRMSDFFQRARRDLAVVLETEPESVVAYRELITMAMADSEEEEMQRLYGRAEAIQPLSFQLRRAYMNAIIPRWGGSYRRMKSFIRKTAPHAKRNPRLRILAGFVSWDRGRSARNQDYDAQAVRDFTEALSHGVHGQFLESRGRTYLAHRQYEAALDDFDTALALSPQNQEFLLLRAKALLGAGRTQEASDSLATALALDPTNADCLEWKKNAAKHLVHEGYQKANEQKTQEALAQFDAAIALSPENVESYYWKGRALLQQGRHTEALDAFERAIAADPKHIESYKNIDWLLAQRGDWDGIIGHWGRFLAEQPDCAEALLERGGAFHRKGDLASALAHV